MKLELKHLSIYLPYDLQIIRVLSPIKNEKNIMTGITEKGIFYNQYSHVPYNHIKPILRPLEDLFFNLSIKNENQKPFEYLEDFADTETERMFLDIIENQNTKFILEKIQYAPLSFIQKLLEWHFDIFGLINAKLAVDINCL